MPSKCFNWEYNIGDQVWILIQKYEPVKKCSECGAESGRKMSCVPLRVQVISIRFDYGLLNDPIVTELAVSYVVESPRGSHWSNKLYRCEVDAKAAADKQMAAYKEKYPEES